MTCPEGSLACHAPKGHDIEMLTVGASSFLLSYIGRNRSLNMFDSPPKFERHGLNPLYSALSVMQKASFAWSIYGLPSPLPT